MKRYISVIALSEDLESVVLLQKQKGPEHLIGKWIIPGGGVEKTDTSLSEAAAREFKEETGCDVPADKMIPIFKKGNEHFELNVFFAIGDVSGAKQQPGEVEPIEVRNWAKVKAQLSAGDSSYADDFVEIMRALESSPHAIQAQEQALDALEIARTSDRKKRVSP